MQGRKDDQGKLRIDLLPVEAINGVAAVLTFGADKYGDRNWENGIDYSRVYAALLRHLFSWWAGKDFDNESGIHHIHHVACCCAFLQTYIERDMQQFDNRPITKENRE